MTGPVPAPSAWDEAVLAARLALRGGPGGSRRARAGEPGPARERWLDILRDSLPGDTPWRRLPAHVTDDRLLGGLDLGATLVAGRPVLQSRASWPRRTGGVLVAPMAERLPPGSAARLCAALDAGEIAVERDGLAARLPARIGLVLLDEGIDDEAPPPAIWTAWPTPSTSTPLASRLAPTARATARRRRGRARCCPRWRPPTRIWWRWWRRPRRSASCRCARPWPRCGLPGRRPPSQAGHSPRARTS